MKLIKDMSIGELRVYARKQAETSAESFDTIFKRLRKIHLAAKKRASLWG